MSETNERYIIECETSEWLPGWKSWYWRRSDKSEATPENPFGRRAAPPPRRGEPAAR
jgi:hypothetical protein